MKRDGWFYTLVVLMSALSLNLSVRCFAQEESEALIATRDAELDAEDDVNTALWLAAGGILGTAGSCLLGSIAMGGAYIYQPVPPRRSPAG